MRVEGIRTESGGKERRSTEAGEAVDGNNALRVLLADLEELIDDMHWGNCAVVKVQILLSHIGL